MKYRSIATIDPAGAAPRLGAHGDGIVWAVLATGVEGSHPHFKQHGNLDVTPPVRHRDFTLLLQHRDSDEEAEVHAPDEELLAEEALIDVQGIGTHVAGVIAGYSDVADKTIEWEIDEPLAGVAPRCKLVSLKVLNDSGEGDERSIIAALEYIQSLNADAGKLLIHGVVIPLSINSDLRNFACGRTPLCDTVTKLIESGVVVVAPSGNEGMKGLSTITDPGNAERAITVGSTNSFRPQEYGASFFSSRGPTSDGRAKPDLLAPGERIVSAIPPQGRSRAQPQKKKAGRKRMSESRPVADYRRMDGTAMAAAHVAGVVAAILSVRPELIGKPDDVKKLLLGSATDLGRDRYCQGRGLVNLSRALDPQAQIETKIPTEETRVELVSHEPSGVIVPAAEGKPAVTTRGAVKGKRFAVAFSFAGEHNDYIWNVVKALRQLGGLARSSIFYHKNFEAELSRLDLDTYLQNIYNNESELLVVFLSAEYEKKQWTRLEWRVMRELIKQKEGEAVMLIRFDETPIPGLFSLDGYVSAVNRDPKDIADLILDRLELNRERSLA